MLWGNQIIPRLVLASPIVGVSTKLAWYCKLCCEGWFTQMLCQLPSDSPWSGVSDAQTRPHKKLRTVSTPVRSAPMAIQSLSLSNTEWDWDLEGVDKTDCQAKSLSSPKCPPAPDTPATLASPVVAGGADGLAEWEPVWQYNDVFAGKSTDRAESGERLRQHTLVQPPPTMVRSRGRKTVTSTAFEPHLTYLPIAVFHGMTEEQLLAAESDCELAREWKTNDRHWVSFQDHRDGQVHWLEMQSDEMTVNVQKIVDGPWCRNLLGVCFRGLKRVWKPSSRTWIRRHLPDLGHLPLLVKQPSSESESDLAESDGLAEVALTCLLATDAPAAFQAPRAVFSWQGKRSIRQGTVPPQSLLLVMRNSGTDLFNRWMGQSTPSLAQSVELRKEVAEFEAKVLALSATAFTWDCKPANAVYDPRTMDISLIDADPCYFCRWTGTYQGSRDRLQALVRDCNQLCVALLAVLTMAEFCSQARLRILFGALWQRLVDPELKVQQGLASFPECLRGRWVEASGILGNLSKRSEAFTDGGLTLAADMQPMWVLESYGRLAQRKKTIVLSVDDESFLRSLTTPKDHRKICRLVILASKLF